MVTGCNFVWYATLQVIAFILVVAGMQLSMFDANFQAHEKPCVTLWGYKENCRGYSVDVSINDLLKDCPSMRERFLVGQLFALVTAFLSAASVLLAIAILKCCIFFTPWFSIAFHFLGGIAACVVWACMVTVYYNDYDVCDKFKGTYRYGFGFVLFVVHWCLDVASIPILLFHDPS